MKTYIILSCMIRYIVVFRSADVNPKCSIFMFSEISNLPKECHGAGWIGGFFFLRMQLYKRIKKLKIIQAEDLVWFEWINDTSEIQEHKKVLWNPAFGHFAKVYRHSIFSCRALDYVFILRGLGCSEKIIPTRKDF